MVKRPEAVSSNLPGLCLEACPRRQQCSAEPAASASGLHSRDDPSCCRLTEEIQFRVTMQLSSSAQVSSLDSMSEERSIITGDRPLRGFSHHGVQTLRLKLMMVRVSREGGNDKVSGALLSNGEPGPTQAALCGATRWDLWLSEPTVLSSCHNDT